ncbi:carboxypeptidase regulatory-like domain-containing protein [Streptodolium elevatio]|uniref:Carboxypeptidase regulatory-like domain-containing protein n=1 Tax=Streptodolium elevatio TaxID=3157996 RepID=A0ABV3DE21_9ACTN
MRGSTIWRVLVAAVAVTVLGGSLGACVLTGDDKDGAAGTSAGDASGGSSDQPKKPGDAKVEPGVVKGRVVGTDGKPIANAEIVVDNQLLYDSNLVLATDAHGEYRAELPPIAATYRVTASFKTSYEGEKATFPLAPDDDAAFAGNQGAVRDFTWKLTGKRDDMPDMYYGGSVTYYLGATNPVDDSYADSANVRLMLTPVGPLVDGSAGKPVTTEPEQTGNGWEVRDVPVGRYRITAVYAADGRRQPLKVQLRNSGKPFAAEVTAVFENELDHYRIELELKF